MALKKKGEVTKPEAIGTPNTHWTYMVPSTCRQCW